MLGLFFFILYFWIYLELAVVFYLVEAEVGDEEGGDYVFEVVVDLFF